MEQPERERGEKHEHQHVETEHAAAELTEAFRRAEEDVEKGRRIADELRAAQVGLLDFRLRYEVGDLRVDVKPLRREAAAIIERMAAQVNGRLSDEEKIAVSPHVLRHTFLRKLAETKGVHYAREASGHQSDRYIWRYVKPDQQTLADAIDELE